MQPSFALFVVGAGQVLGAWLREQQNRNPR